MDKVKPSEIVETNLIEFSEHVKTFMDSKNITLDIALLLLEALKVKYKTYLEDFRYAYLELENEDTEQGGSQQ